MEDAGIGRYREVHVHALSGSLQSQERIHQPTRGKNPKNFVTVLALGRVVLRVVPCRPLPPIHRINISVLANQTLDSPEVCSLHGVHKRSAAHVVLNIQFCPRIYQSADCKRGEVVDVMTSVAMFSCLHLDPRHDTASKMQGRPSLIVSNVQTCASIH